MIHSKLLFLFKPSVYLALESPIMPQQLHFQSPFDHAAYRHAKAKGKGSTKPIHSKNGISKSTTGTSGTVTMNVSNEFPPIETLLPIDVYDLTAEDESFVSLPKPTYQQATQASERQATQEHVIQEQATQEQVTQEQATQERATQGQPTQGQPTQELATGEQAHATPEVEDSNNQGVHCVP